MSRRIATESEGEVSRWQGLIAQHEASGESIRAFCARSGIAGSTFYLWRRRLGRVGGDRLRSPVRAGGRARQSPAQPDAFIALGSSRLPGIDGQLTGERIEGRIELRLDLGDGIVLHVRRG